MTSRTLQEVADHLGVHYMTAYKYVRTGRLDATKLGATWQVDAESLKAFEDRRSGIARPDTGHHHDDDTWFRLYKRLIAGDEAGAWGIIETALASDLRGPDVYSQLLTPAMTLIGENWSNGVIDVADEHLASAVANRLVGRLGSLFSRPGRSRGTVIVAMVAGDQHALPSAMFADLLRLRRFEVIDLGANTPAQSVVTTARKADRALAIGLCAVCDQGAAQLQNEVSEIAAAKLDIPLFVGGPAAVLADLDPKKVTVTTTAEAALTFIDEVDNCPAVAP